MSVVGNAGVISIDDNTGTAQTVAEVRSYSIEATSDTIEKTVMGNATRQYVKGISSFSGSADVYWDPTHFTTIDLNPTEGSVGATNKVVTLTVYPEGSGSVPSPIYTPGWTTP